MEREAGSSFEIRVSARTPPPPGGALPWPGSRTPPSPNCLPSGVWVTLARSSRPLREFERLSPAIPDERAACPICRRVFRVWHSSSFSWWFEVGFKERISGRPRSGRRAAWASLAGSRIVRMAPWRSSPRARKPPSVSSTGGLRRDPAQRASTASMRAGGASRATMPTFASRADTRA